MLIDTHAHLNFKAYKDDLDEVIKRTLAENIRVVNVGTKYETSKKAVEIAEKYEGMYASIGMHPIHIKTDLFKIKTDEEEGAFQPFGEEFDKARYKDLVLRSRSDEGKNKIVAIGEIGLDYYLPSQILRSKTWEGEPKTNTKLGQFKEKQKEVFIKQLELAQELRLPVILHCRMAHEDIITTLQQYNNTTLRGVVHCFTGTIEEAEKYLEMGFYLGFNGIIFKLNLDEVIKKIPLERILIETDCPYLTPPLSSQIFQGKTWEDKRNEPIFIKYVVQKIAELKNLNFQEVADITAKNAQNLFGI